MATIARNHKLTITLTDTEADEHLPPVVYWFPDAEARDARMASSIHTFALATVAIRTPDAAVLAVWNDDGTLSGAVVIRASYVGAA